MRSFLWTILIVSLVLIGLAEFAPAWAIFGSTGDRGGTVIGALCAFANDGRQAYYAAASVSVLGIAVLAIFGKINWGWVGTLIGALFFIGVLANVLAINTDKTRIASMICFGSRQTPENLQPKGPGPDQN